MNKASSLGILRSSHTPSRGGLAVGLALCALGGDLGAGIKLELVTHDNNMTDDELLFSESNSRFIVTVARQNRKKLERVMKNIPCSCIGAVVKDKKLTVQGANERRIIHADLDELRKSFKKTLYGV
jgi:phosphoribosylformylglycinamidine synthase